MKLNRIFLAAAAAALLVACGPRSYTDFVDPAIGTGGHGHVAYAASVPFGMVQAGPTSIPASWDWCSGYHESDSTVIGFSHTHLSGTGCPDLTDITVIPVVGRDLTYARGVEQDQNSGLWSYADRSTQVCRPGYYKVRLERYDVLCEMSATERVAIHRYTFPKDAGDAAIVFDLENGLPGEGILGADIEIIDNQHIVGYRHSRAWADNERLFFAAEFDRPFDRSEVFRGLYWRFDFDGAGEVMAKVALSPTSTSAARANLEAELPGWDLEAVRKAADEKWNAQLSKVRIKTRDADSKKIFYTAFYHSMIMPFLHSDNGAPDRYTGLSLWDTYRAQMPLFSILHPERENDMADTFLDIFDQQGDLPVWHLMGCETDCMIGNPGIPVLADIVLKGFDGFDVEKAYEAMKVTAMTPDRGQDIRMKYGVIPSILHNQAVAYETEYALADWAFAQVALKLGRTEDYDYFLERSHSYRPHFDRESGFIRGLNPDGSFTEPFNPYYSNHTLTEYCEGNAWQYAWLVPHDLKGLEELHGSREKTIERLDTLFSTSSNIDGENASADMSGLIGQYVHGNEPSHHIVYFYTMLGQPWKTADLVRKIFNELYAAAPDGLSGNEDAGQMSAWYMISAMGFYQVEPAGGRYYFGSPIFDELTIALPQGRQFRIVAKNTSDTNRYIQSITLNGEPYAKPYIDYKDIISGGEIVFQMGSEKTIWYGEDEII